MKVQATVNGQTRTIEIESNNGTWWTTEFPFLARTRAGSKVHRVNAIVKEVAGVWHPTFVMPVLRRQVYVCGWHDQLAADSAYRSRHIGG